VKSVLITKITKPFDQKLAGAFVREGYKVFTIGGHEAEGVTLLPDDFNTARSTVIKEAGRLDLYVDVSDERDASDSFTIRDGLDEKVICDVYEANVLRPMALLEAFLPLLDMGQGRRLCFLTSAGASVNRTRETSGYAYNLSKAALHQFIQMISNKLVPSGYTFRVYDPMHGEVPVEAAAEGAFNYFVRRRGTEGRNPLRDDEARLVFRDALGRENAW